MQNFLKKLGAFFRTGLGILLLEGIAAGLVWLAWRPAGKIPLIDEFDYSTPTALIRAAMVALAFALGLAGVRTTLIALLSDKPPQSDNFSPEVQALLSARYQDESSGRLGLRLITNVLAIVIGLALTVCATLLIFALWKISPI